MTSVQVPPIKIGQVAKRKRESDRPAHSSSERLKAIVRRLPPNLPEDIFWQSVQNWVGDNVVWKAFYPGKLSTRCVASLSQRSSSPNPSLGPTKRTFLQGHTSHSVPRKNSPSSVANMTAMSSEIKLVCCSDLLLWINLTSIQAMSIKSSSSMHLTRRFLLRRRRLIAVMPP
jgi:hypothetical protein